MRDTASILVDRLRQSDAVIHVPLDDNTREYVDRMLLAALQEAVPYLPVVISVDKIVILT